MLLTNGVDIKWLRTMTLISIRAISIVSDILIGCVNCLKVHSTPCRNSIPIAYISYPAPWREKLNKIWRLYGVNLVTKVLELILKLPG